METLQEREMAASGDPWWVLLVCVLLNRSRGAIATSVVTRLRGVAPNASTLVRMDLLEIEALIRPLGFPRIRASRLRRLAEVYTWLEVMSSPETFRETVAETLRRGGLPGCGPYALEAWRMFALKKRGFVPQDRILRARMEELLSC